jgi:two-component system, OmpR family, sensor histidine kinase VicK
LKLSFSCSKNVPIVNVDKMVTCIAMQNLLTNAIKYTPEGGSITMTIDKDAKRPCIIITVTDTGYGIPEDQQQRVFEKFFRADNIREKETDGTGLGLYIVNEMIKHTGGRVWFTSKENKGSSFYISIPTSGMCKKEGSKPIEEVA